MRTAGGGTTLGRECLEPETVAALVDGRLTAAERTAALDHLSGCEACYELFAETSRAIVEEEGAAAPVRPRPRTWIMPALAAASVVLALVVGLLLVRRPARVTVAGLASALPSGASAHLRPLPVQRGASATAGTGAAVGALLVDLRVAADAGDEARGRGALERLALELAAAAHLDEEAGWAREAAGRPMQPDQWRRLDEALEARAAERFPPPWPDTGKLLAAGRLAAATRTAGFFTVPRRRVIEQAREAAVDPALSSALQEVLTEWDRSPRDLAGLERALAQALHAAVQPR